MNNFENILVEFKKANTQQRIELFMLHRNLRTDFDQIENEDSALGTEDFVQIVIEPSKTDNRQSLFVRMKRLYCSILP
jgi:hypothetical protein